MQDATPELRVMYGGEGDGPSLVGRGVLIRTGIRVLLPELQR